MSFRTWHEDKKNDAVTRQELKNELRKTMSNEGPVTFNSYSLPNLVDETVNAIIQDRGRTVASPVTTWPPETITQAELEDALEDLGWGYPKAKAQTFFDRVKSRREPEWKHGDVVKDANGIVWFRNSVMAVHPWLKPGSSSSHAESEPKRPLTRMVEGA